MLFRSFVTQNHVRYFVDNDPLNPIDAERWQGNHIALSKAVVARLKPHSRLILRDHNMYLYEIMPTESRP